MIIVTTLMQSLFLMANDIITLSKKKIVPSQPIRLYMICLSYQAKKTPKTLKQFGTFVRSGLGSSCTLIMYARVKSTKATAPRLITNRTMGGLFLKKLFKFSQIAQSNAMAVMFFSPWKSEKIILWINFPCI